MENVIKRFERLKNMLISQGAPVMGEAVTKAFVAALEEYQSVLAEVIDKENIRINDVKAENDLLRGLIGLSDEELKAQLISQGGEIHFLRAKALEMKNAAEKKSRENDELKLCLEESKNDTVRSLNERERERLSHEHSLNQLGLKLKELENKTDQKRQLLLSRLQESCDLVTLKAQVCAERLSSIKSMPFFENLAKEDSELIAGNIADIESISENGKKIAQLLNE